MAQQFSEAEIADFLAQLDGFRRSLGSRQQRILDALLEAAATGELEAGIDPDVEGFVWQQERPVTGYGVEPKRIARVLRRVPADA